MNIIDGISFFTRVFAAFVISLIFALIPEGIAYGLYNFIDPISEIGRIITIMGLIVITAPFALWFTIGGVGVFAFLSEEFLR